MSMRFGLLAGCLAMLVGGCVAVPGETAAPVAVAPVLTPQPAAATAHPELWPKAASPAAFSDAATEQLITKLVGDMTLEQKVGQVIQADITAITPEDFAKYPIGSVLAGGNSGPNGNDRSSAADWAALAATLRAASAKAIVVDGVAIPAIFGIDAVHGHSNIPGATIYPHNIGLGAAHDPGLIGRIGQATSEEITATGIDWTFAPTLAVPQDVRWGRSYEGYSSDPAVVASYAGAMVLGLQGKLVAGEPLAANRSAATAKHFVADGGTHDGIDQGDAQISEQELISVHAAGYPPAIDAGALTVMASFSSWNGLKNHANRSLLTDIVKGRFGFAGFIVGDWNAQGKIPGCEPTHCPEAMNAGLDMYMAPDSWRGLFDNTLADVRAGRISMTRLDDAVTRILRVKAKLGLLGNHRAAEFHPDEIGSPAHQALAREAVRKSLVLLKNAGGLLPLQPGQRVLVAGDGADNLAKQAGGWTITWQGVDTSKADFPQAQTVWDGLSAAITAAGGTAQLSPDGSYAERPDVAVVVIGEGPYAEFQGDIHNLAYQAGDPRDLELIRRLKAAGIKVVTVFISGRPLFTSPEINASDAFVAAWLPGTQGGGIADVLVAGADGQPRFDFTGRLSFPWPDDARSPITRPAFPLGYGLHYGEDGAVGPLNEDPRIDISDNDAHEFFFAAGRVPQDWHLELTDSGGAATVGTGSTESPAGKLSTRAFDLAAQEDSRLLSWTGPATAAITGSEADLSRYVAGSFAVKLELVVRQPPAGKLDLLVNGNPVALAAKLQAAGPVTLEVPLACFTAAGGDFTRVKVPLALRADAPAELVLHRAEMVPVAAGKPCT